MKYDALLLPVGHVVETEIGNVTYRKWSDNGITYKAEIITGNIITPSVRNTEQLIRFEHDK